MLKKCKLCIFLVRFFKSRYHALINKHIPSLSNPVAGTMMLKKESGFILNFSRDNYFTFYLRPKKTRDIESISTSGADYSNCAIIIQGPIGEYAGFLIETIKLYKKIFPEIMLIISTWSNECGDNLEKVKKEGVHLLLSDPLECPGMFNIDSQIKTTNVGITYAKENNIKYCLKSRADCRIYNQNAISYLLSILKTFVLKKKNKYVNYRIVASSVASCKYRVYGVTDILLFGEVSDMHRYFSLELHERWLREKDINSEFPIIEGTPVISEIFLCARYLDSIGIELQWTLDHWWECLKDFFCIIDSDSMDFFWYKYDWQFEGRFKRNYAHKDARSIEFSDWIILYTGEVDSVNWESLDYKEKWEVLDGKMVQKNILL